jgi:hypothetical protein
MDSNHRSAVTRELCWRFPPLLPVRERERFSAISSAQPAIPCSRSPMWFGWVAVYRAARRPLRCGGTTRIYLRFSSARPAFAERRTKASTRSGEYPAAARSISEVKFVIWSSSCGKGGQALMGGFASSRILEIHGERMIKRTFDPGFRIELYQKDLTGR